MPAPAVGAGHPAHPAAGLVALLYLAALVVLLITAFWEINPFTTNIQRAGA